MSEGGFRGEDRLTYGPAELEAAAAAVRAESSLVPRVALVLGSGLGGYADGLAGRTAVPYERIPGFPKATVAGHAGRLVLGTVGETPVVAQQGRLHVYEGWSAAQVTFPLRVMYALGARVLLLTNAAGGVNRNFRIGDFMLIEDQVNFQFRSPLRGAGPLVDSDRFVDMARAFSPRLTRLAEDAARAHAIPGVRRGVYWGNLGPAYETPAEVRMAGGLGGDAVGMSTVPEVVTASHLGMETVGIACISNAAAGLSDSPLTHDEVIAVTDARRAEFTRFLDIVIPQL